ncbi:MAG: BamA/TamA family outer membrane protein [Muribaculaceae bacterium]
MQNKIKYILYALIALVISGCSTTRRIEADEMLYTGVKDVEFAGSVTPEVCVQDEIELAVDVAPNKYTITPSMRIPIGLWVYNNWNPEAGGLKGWMYRKLVEEPVLVSDVRPEVRTKMIDEILADNGYFRGSSSYTLNQGKNKKKASITYTVNSGPAYKLDSIIMLPDTCRLYHLIDSVAARDSYLQKGSRYCVDSLTIVRNRITNGVRNRGYYYFRPEYIEYLADSLQNRGNITLKLCLSKSVPQEALNEYVTGNVTILTRRYEGGGTPDTIATIRGTIIQMQPSKLRHEIIPECVSFRSGRTFSVRQMDRTHTRLSRLGIFNSISMDIQPDTTAAKPTLDVLIDCTFDSPLETSIEVGAAYKSNNYLGPGATFSVTNKNLFGGGEQLTVGLNGSYEWQTGTGSSSLLNSYEIGLNTSLAFPRLIAPKFIPRRNRNLNWTRFGLSADLLNRPHYFKMAQFDASVSYDWYPSRYSSSTFTPIKFTYTKLINTTEAFDSIVAENRAIEQSFRSQYIPQVIYSYTYSRAFDSKNSINFNVTLQEAGNVFWGIYELCGSKGEKQLFGTPFSQFVKGSVQLVYNRRLFGNHHLVTRVATGAAHAYGNASQVPYSEQFYVGGASSIRAFTVRSIGPGSYHVDEETANGYFDQTGTFKFEFNTEYRFPLYGPLGGALFIDAGNVWLIKEDPDRRGGTLKASRFFKDLALGTGVGLRFDIGMIVVRGDLGIGIHAPYDTGKSGYFNMKSFGKALAFHLAIGYPF